MIRKPLPWLVLFVLAFSGCLGIVDDGLEDGESNGDVGADATGNDGGAQENEAGDGADGGEGGEGNATEDPLTASLEANVTKGSAPLSVAFSVNGTVGEDRPLQWSLKSGDDELGSGETLPETVEYTFEGAGNHTVLLEVTDGVETVEANVTVEVVEEIREPNEVQTGSSGDCMDYVALWQLDGVHSPLAGDEIEVDPGSEWEATSDDGVPWVDFFDADGAWLEESTSGSGTVPAAAAYGLICVTDSGGWPDVFFPGSQWSYQDGL